MKIFDTRYLVTDQKTVNVIGILDTNKKYGEFTDNKGYVKFENPDDEASGTIWIFAANGKPLCSDKFPFFWFNNDHTKIEFSSPDEFTLKAFGFNNAKPFNVNAVIENTTEHEQLFDAEEIADMNAAASFFIPIINDNDDFLKKIVKSIIINKKVDINRLKSKTDEKYQLPNMKAALTGSTAMSVKNFIRWISLLGCEFEMVINDDSDIQQKDVLNNPLVYRSSTNKMYEASNSEMIEIDQSNYTDHDATPSEEEEDA